jgi:peptide/nickel transport system substrate-binding protein
LLLGLPAVAPAAAEESGDEKITFTVGLLDEVDSFNPFKGIQATSYEMWALTYDMLVGYSMEDMSPTPALAEEWEPSEDGLTWTFHLRDDVTWSDGEALTSADVKHTYDRIIDGGVEADSWGSYLAGVTTVDAPDDHTVVLNLDTASATLPLLPIEILPEHIWKDISEEEANTYANEPEDGQPVVGSGPFRFVEGTAGGSTYRFEANPDYWGGAPHVDEVVYRVFKAEDPAVQALIKGEIDFLHNITPLQLDALDEREGITTVNGVSPYFEEFAFNTGAIDTETGEPIGTGAEALKDSAFRHALGYAVDWDRLLDNAYQGAADPGQTVVPDFYTSFHWSPPEDEAFTYDPEMAKQLLDEAGYEEGADGLRTMPDGSQIGTLELIARPEEKRSATSMDFLKEWLADVGIDAEVKVMESGQLTTAILDGEFDIFHWGWYVEPDPDGILSYLTCKERGNWSDSWYCNEEYDRLYEEQHTELDDEKRAELVHQMQQILWEDSPYLVIGYTKTGQAFRSDRFACFQPQPDPDGVLLVQYGARNYTLVRPADEAGDCDGVTSAIGLASSETGGGGGDSDDGSNTGIVVAGGLLVLVLLAGGGFMAFRRRATAAERE